MVRSKKVFIKQILICLCCFCAVSMQAMPPKLYNAGNSCYCAALVQNLLNMQWIEKIISSIQEQHYISASQRITEKYQEKVEKSIDDLTKNESVNTFKGSIKGKEQNFNMVGSGELLDINVLDSFLSKLISFGVKPDLANVMQAFNDSKKFWDHLEKLIGKWKDIEDAEKSIQEEKIKKGEAVSPIGPSKYAWEKRVIGSLKSSFGQVAAGINGYKIDQEKIALIRAFGQFLKDKNFANFYTQAVVPLMNKRTEFSGLYTFIGYPAQQDPAELFGYFLDGLELVCGSDWIGTDFGFTGTQIQQISLSGVHAGKDVLRKNFYRTSQFSPGAMSEQEVIAKLTQDHPFLHKTPFSFNSGLFSYSDPTRIEKRTVLSIRPNILSLQFLVEDFLLNGISEPAKWTLLLEESSLYEDFNENKEGRNPVDVIVRFNPQHYGDFCCIKIERAYGGALNDIGTIVNGNLIITINNRSYALIGVTIGGGGIGGHCEAVIKDTKEQKPFWYRCSDDSIVSTTLQNEAPSIAHNGNLFFFKKVGPELLLYNFNQQLITLKNKVVSTI
ncbi:MAG: hypothetical protein UU47_C0002G0044 [candidate division TM6 bacterium GW2011_GWE2_41_16]|nr:MAG: hypothetical protein UU47_C0002G0044 [candidate division TM6 bacterium GW2011_GWE2_41_16]